MTVIALDGLDLSALLCSRVCHDVISPVGAIINGLEVLAEERDADMRAFALDLIKRSANTASARLQFCRLAFGAAGSAGAMIDTGDAEQVARGLLSDEKTKFSWSGPRILLAKNKVKLLLNLCLVAGSCIPRGGNIDVVLEGADDHFAMAIKAQGANFRIASGIEALIAGAPEHGAIDSHAIQPYYTGLVARASNMAVTMTILPDGVLVRAHAKAQATDKLSSSGHSETNISQSPSQAVA